jgi:hypothetical protein
MNTDETTPFAQVDSPSRWHAEGKKVFEDTKFICECCNAEEANAVASAYTKLLEKYESVIKAFNEDLAILVSGANLAIDLAAGDTGSTRAAAVTETDADT